MKVKLLVLALCGSFATAAQAEGLGVYVNGGTTGFGLGVAGGTDSVAGRFGFTTWNRSFDQTDANGSYKIDLKLQTVSALADWYPFKGAFRTSFGVYYNGNKATLSAIANGTYTFNGQTFTAAEVGSYTGEMTFSSTAPYLGIGWGNPVGKDKTWGLVSDIGILFQGSPRITANATCGAAIVGTPRCAKLQSDVALGAAKLESDLKNFKYYPVVSIGLSYRF